MRDTCSISTPLGNIRIFAESNGHIELGLGDLPTLLLNGMKVEKVVACVLRVHSIGQNTDIHFSAHLENAPNEGSPETGECLDCQTWESEKWAMSVGTEDQEALNGRLPELGISEMPYPIDYAPFDIKLRLNGLKLKKPTTFHFIIAYKRLLDDRECSTWFAVDVPHEVAYKVVNWTP